MSIQLTMDGNDWKPDSYHKQQKRAAANRAKTGRVAAKKLEAAADALKEFLLACNECDDLSGDKMHGGNDSRRRLMADLLEYAGYLEWKYGGTDAHSN